MLAITGTVQDRRNITFSAVRPSTNMNTLVETSSSCRSLHVGLHDPRCPRGPCTLRKNLVRCLLTCRGHGCHVAARRRAYRIILDTSIATARIRLDALWKIEKERSANDGLRASNFSIVLSQAALLENCLNKVCKEHCRRPSPIQGSISPTPHLVLDVRPKVAPVSNSHVTRLTRLDKDLFLTSGRCPAAMSVGTVPCEQR